jgi:hypothetical protein
MPSDLNPSEKKRKR